MQGISERIKGSGIWWIRWTGADGKRHFEKAGTHNAARTLLNKRRQEIILRKKQPKLLRSRAVTFSDLCDDALRHSGAENSKKQTYELGLRINQLRPVFGSRSADSIRKNEVVEWLTEQAEEREWAATTRNRWQATFSLIFRVGLDNERIERNPAARIRKKAEGGGRVRFLSDPEEKRLRAAIERRFADFLPHFLLSIHTGMRMSEQYGLRWNQVDFERRQLHLIRTKNPDSRIIPLNSVALGALQELRGGQTRPGTDPVFPSVRTGDALQGSRGWFSTALEEAKIQEYTWHCNRHTFASRLVMAGVDLRTVAELLGHRTLQMVMRNAHLAPEHQASAVDRLVPAGERVVTKSATGKSEAKKPKQNQTLTH
ncbi:MAG: site-specific integrase [Terracidiphilus sp.]|jgi:integrase